MVEDEFKHVFPGVRVNVPLEVGGNDITGENRRIEANDKIKKNLDVMRFSAVQTAEMRSV